MVNENTIPYSWNYNKRIQQNPNLLEAKYKRSKKILHFLQTAWWRHFAWVSLIKFWKKEQHTFHHSQEQRQNSLMISRTTPILSEQQYDAAVIHVRINNLLNVKNSTSITQISRDIIETAQYWNIMKTQLVILALLWFMILDLLISS